MEYAVLIFTAKLMKIFSWTLWENIVFIRENFSRRLSTHSLYKTDGYSEITMKGSYTFYVFFGPYAHIDKMTSLLERGYALISGTRKVDGNGGQWFAHLGHGTFIVAPPLQYPLQLLLSNFFNRLLRRNTTTYIIPTSERLFSSTINHQPTSPTGPQPTTGHQTSVPGDHRSTTVSLPPPVRRRFTVGPHQPASPRRPCHGWPPTTGPRCPPEFRPLAASSLQPSSLRPPSEAGPLSATSHQPPSEDVPQGRRPSATVPIPTNSKAIQKFLTSVIEYIQSSSTIYSSGVGNLREKNSLKETSFSRNVPEKMLINVGGQNVEQIPL